MGETRKISLSVLFLGPTSRWIEALLIQAAELGYPSVGARPARGDVLAINVAGLGMRRCVGHFSDADMHYIANITHVKLGSLNNT